MNTQVTLTIKKGPFHGQKLVLDKGGECTVGRAEDCSLQIPSGLLYQMISRHHCLLDIKPPHVQVRDLGSRNGTYVNGQLVGKRANPDVLEEGPPGSLPGCELADGDELALGPVAFQVHINPPADAPEELADCSDDWPSEAEDGAEPEPGVACPHSQGVW